MGTLASAIAIGALSTLASLPALAQPPTSHAGLVGVWTNTNSSTRSIVRIEIRASGSALTVHPYGACTPTPCDHGVIRAAAFSPSVSNIRSNGFRAGKSFGFKTTWYNGFLAGQRLSLMTQDTFSSGDSRYDYTTMETFVKTGALGTEEAGPVRGDHATDADLR